MATQPEGISQQSSPLVPSEDLRESVYASSAGGYGDGPNGRRRSLRVTVLLTDAAVLVLSLGHLTLTILLMCYHGRPINASYDILQSILTTIGPIFPMVFSFIISRLLYHAARFRLENGVSLGALEQLMGSRTVGSAVATHFELLGGQSFLRVLDMTYPPVNTSLFYMNTLKKGLHFDFHNDSNKGVSYISAFYSNEFGRSGPTDLWGNIKIPLLEVDSKSDAWHNIDHDTASYSAFIGLAIGNASVGKSTFDLETSYLQLNCDSVTSHLLDKSSHSFLEAETPISEQELDDVETILHSSDGNRTFPVTEGGRAFVNGSWYGFQHARSPFYVDWNIATNRFVDKLWFTVFNARHDTDSAKYESYGFPSMSFFENETAIEAGPTYLLFQARRNVSRVNPDLGKWEFLSVDVQKAKCLVLQKYIESRVTCSRPTHESIPDCRVESQRPSQKQHPSENLSILSHPLVFGYLSKNLPIALQTHNVFDTTLWGIADQTRPQSPFEPMLPDFTNISTSQLSRGLAKVINSYMLVNQANMDVLPRVRTVLSSLDGFNNEFARKGWSFASAETTHLTRVFRVSWLWMTACFASCAVLATCGIMGIILVHRGNSPEILGFVSAIVRDSRYIKIPTDVDHMNGEDLSRMLKSERLRYGYTSSESMGKPQMGIGLETEITKVEG
ncbi:unnamed protein product [Clonostachys rosea f. rosea IK726]|uniref:Uncharacterized protein n=1 Tax=Clonostachys rosea f. rosea IK726 TaxID=1349383 RepID=A0ACA9UTP2_BIOOC|nr:unnamed protein product [Clonostachys rosea f. rosea IK726]